jgi:hypothetical protein
MTLPQNKRVNELDLKEFDWEKYENVTGKEPSLYQKVKRFAFCLITTANGLLIDMSLGGSIVIYESQRVNRLA